MVPESNKNGFVAGAAAADITPAGSVFLFGYPNVSRWSTGIHDPLLASALYLANGADRCLFLSADVIFISADLSRRVRQRIEQLTSIPAGNILLSTTHTHSGPTTVNCLSCAHDQVVPNADPDYLSLLENRLMEAARRAYESAEPAQLGLNIADSTGIGTNRRDPSGPIDTQMPVLMARSSGAKAPLAVLVVCNMHPTVMHQDSTLISGDFPGLARQHLQRHSVGDDCPILWNTGPAGNLSPRHVVRANTFEEARRIGAIASDAIAHAIEGIASFDTPKITCRQAFIDLPLREFASPDAAKASLEAAIRRLDTLRRNGAPRHEVRTAECDWFGAQEALTLSQAALDGRVNTVAASCMPAEIQLIRVGRWNFVGWPGEIFVEFGLQLKRACPDTFPIAYANGELQGYLVTRKAVEEGGYEASNALFRSPDSGEMLLDATKNLIAATL